jgi:hypothetical protein
MCRHSVAPCGMLSEGKIVGFAFDDNNNERFKVWQPHATPRVAAMLVDCCSHLQPEMFSCWQQGFSLMPFFVGVSLCGEL